MDRVSGRMVGWLALLVAALLAVPPAASAQSRADRQLTGQLMDHIRILSSDEFQGREPGTEGEAMTLRYLAREWFQMGLVSGTNDPGNDWFAPVTLVAGTPASSSVQFSRRGRRIYAPTAEVLALTSGQRSLVRDAPVVFVGKALDTMPSRTELAGRVAMLLDGSATDSERQNALLAAGASAVLTVLDGDRTLQNVAARRKRSGYALADDDLGGDLEAFITRKAMDRILRAAGGSLAALEAAAARPGFAPRPLDLAVTLEATTDETTIRTHNLIGKIPGKKPARGAVLFVAHWDHFGLCAEPPAEDTVCNGAIDNASGLGALTEVARRLLRGGQMDRDVYFLATTAEELGLLGAHAFAEKPPLPLDRIVAAFNIDSIAIAPAGSPFAIVGRGMTPLDKQIEAAARRARVRIVPGDAANAHVRRQDGWALLQHDIPAVMVTTAYSDLARMEAFFEGDYHRPSDQLGHSLELGGAADDVKFLAFLGRWFANPRQVPLPAK
jgi:hypothetical protein